MKNDKRSRSTRSSSHQPRRPLRSPSNSSDTKVEPKARSNSPFMSWPSESTKQHLKMCENWGPGKLMSAQWLTGCNMGCYCTKCPEATAKEPWNRQDNECTACLEEGHEAEPCPVWIKPSVKALRRLQAIEDDERTVTNRFAIFTPRGSRQNSLWGSIVEGT